MKDFNKIFFKNNFGWKKIKYKDSSIFFKGYLYNDNFSNILRTIFNINNKKKYIKNLDGMFAFIATKSSKVIAVTDKISSIPIFFQKDKNEIIISNKSQLIQDKKKNKLLKKSLTSYFMSGYTIGNSTIYENIKSIEPGTYLESYQNKIKFTKYYKFEPWKYKKNMSLKLLEKKYSDCNLKVFNKLKTYCDNNNLGVAVSLTAGYDSRLIVSMLKKLKFKNILCFTYGIKNNYEVKAARKICKYLDIKHVYIETNNLKVKKICKTKHFKKFYKNSEQSLSVLDNVEYLVINELKNKRLIDDKIIINGLSGDFISGGHQLEKFLDPSKKGLDQTIDAIIKKHFKLWLGKNEFINYKIINESLNEYLVNLKVKIKKKNNFGLIEYFDLFNRQSKYSLSRQQVYDYFNLKWILPHFDIEYLNFWQNVEPGLKTNQKFYDLFLRKKNYEGVWAKKEWTNLRLTRSKPLSIHSILLIPLLKILFFYNKKKYHQYYVKYLDYFNQTLAGYGEFNYFKEVIIHKDIFRNFISLKVKKYISCLLKKYEITKV